MNNLQSFDSGAFPPLSKEQIWSYKAVAVAHHMAIVYSLTKNLSETVHDGVSRKMWADRVIEFLPKLESINKEASDLCNAVTDSNPH